MRKSATKVTLRKRKLPSGKITLYLDFYPPVRDPRTLKLSRREYLGIYIVDKPRNTVDRQNNNEKIRIAEAIRSEREISIMKEQFGFADKTRFKVDFLAYFRNFCNETGQSSVPAVEHFEIYCSGECFVSDITIDYCEKFREYLTSGTAMLAKRKPLSNNRAAQLWSYYKACLRKAYKEGLLLEDIASKLSVVTLEATEKGYLTMDEVRALSKAPCKNDEVKRAGLFSCLCGLRVSDIRLLTWDHIVTAPDGGKAVKIRTKKTGTLALIPVSEEAISLLGEQKKGLIFSKISPNDLKYAIPGWVNAAGITKHVTFHMFRHTYATILASTGTSIYTVSKLLTHSSVKTTQIYADIVDENKRKAAESIKIGLASN